MQSIFKGVFNAITHMGVGVVGGAMLDSFFTTNSNESLFESGLTLAGHTAANGVALSLLNQVSLPANMSAYDDPTSGGFMLIGLIFSQPNYRHRIEQIAVNIQKEVQLAFFGSLTEKRKYMKDNNQQMHTI
jgi:hypothetical protein